MESIPNEDDLKSSSSEEETDDHLGTGRFYECVFCKRGFTTAQALGGHMNIHRKDKAKNRPQNSSSSSSVSDKFVDDHIHNNNYASFRSFSPAAQSYPTTYNHRQYFGIAPEVHVNYQTYFPAVSTNNNNHKNLNVFGDEIWRGNLGLRVGESDHHVAAADHDKDKRQGVGEEDELDLELRLGHHDH